jgi:hypothetical protein
MPLGLALSEKQIPHITENTEKPKQGMELLESVGPRPRQARYQAALRPDMKYVFDFTAIFGIASSYSKGDYARTVQNRSLIGVAVQNRVSRKLLKNKRYPSR